MEVLSLDYYKMATYLFIFYCVFVLFVFPSYITYKRIEINPFKFSKEETAITFITITINAFMPSLMPNLSPIESLKYDYLTWVGIGLLHLSFLIIFIAQRNMANEWRIGIIDENKVNLIKNGLFRISINPIFLGVVLVFFGLFLIIPNAITAAILVSGFIVIQIQVRLEEEFLIKKLGVEYNQYMNNVKRWLL